MSERENVVKTLIEICIGRGITHFDQDKVLEVFIELADMERNKPSHIRVGFSYAMDHLETKGISQILNQARDQWPTLLPKVPLQSVPKDGVHKNECVVSLCLDKNYNPQDLKRIFHDYMINATDLFNCNVVECKPVHDTWYDFHVQYSEKLPKIYELFLAPEWVKDGVTKPLRDFGFRTTATFAR